MAVSRTFRLIRPDDLLVLDVTLVNLQHGHRDSDGPALAPEHP